MTMFPMLDDPHPPIATHHTLTRVHTRARILRRRRRMVAAAPALLAVGVAGAIAPRFRGETPQEVATITSSTLPPATGFGSSTTVLPYDDRGEVFRLAAIPAGWELTQERVLQVPEVGQYERMIGFRLPNDVDPDDPTDPYDRFSIYRYEVSASSEIATRASLLDGGEVLTTPGGREVIRSIGGTNVSLTWFVTDGIWIQLTANLDQDLDLEGVIDSLVYEPPTVRCFDGDVVRTDLPACGPLEYEVL
jgi:hypothetical protein